MSLARVQFFSISLDGFGTGDGLSLDAPFGHAGEPAARVDVRDEVRSHDVRRGRRQAARTTHA